MNTISLSPHHSPYDPFRSVLGIHRGHRNCRHRVEAFVRELNATPGLKPPSPALPQDLSGLARRAGFRTEPAKHPHPETIAAVSIRHAGALVAIIEYGPAGRRARWRIGRWESTDA